MALADREFVNDGSSRWSVAHARRVLEANGGSAQVAPVLDQLKRSARPVPYDWLGNRLSVLWMMFMASRSQVDAETLSLWLAEYLRLLGDLPHDVVARAIDRAVQTARHGFMPSVGEIRTIAEPLVAERTHQIERLAKIAQAGVTQ